MKKIPKATLRSEKKNKCDQTLEKINKQINAIDVAIAAINEKLLTANSDIEEIKKQIARLMAM